MDDRVQMGAVANEAEELAGIGVFELRERVGTALLHTTVVQQLGHQDPGIDRKAKQGQ